MKLKKIYKELFVNETYLNLFKDKLPLYIDQIYNILQRSYAPIGGFLGASSKEDLVNKIWLAKCSLRSGKIIAVTLYKDQNGRKLIGGGHDGTKQGMIDFFKILEEDIALSRSWAEVSGTGTYGDKERCYTYSKCLGI